MLEYYHSFRHEMPLSTSRATPLIAGLIERNRMARATSIALAFFRSGPTFCLLSARPSGFRSPIIELEIFVAVARTVFSTVGRST